MIDPKELQQMGFTARVIHTDSEHNQHGTLATPIYQTSTFIFDSAEWGGRRFALEEDDYIYTRLGNPTCTAAEQKVASLEGGEACVNASSGIGAITSTIYPLVQTDDHIVAGKTLYGYTYSSLKYGLSYFGVEVILVDARNLNEIKAAMHPNTKPVYIGTPANPNMCLTDIESAVKIAHSQEGAVLTVDNTYCTPFITRPLDLGAGVVVHSTMKYPDGYGDAIAGFVIGHKEYIGQVCLFAVKDTTGPMLGSFKAYSIARGIKTLEMRMERHCANAQCMTESLEKYFAIVSIAYPGLRSFLWYKPAQKQVRLLGAMIAFELKGGLKAGCKLIDSLRLATLCVSPSGAETPVERPASMTHSPYTPGERVASDIDEGMVRLSIGLESVEDTIADLKGGLDALL